MRVTKAWAVIGKDGRIVQSADGDPHLVIYETREDADDNTFLDEEVAPVNIFEGSQPLYGIYTGERYLEEPDAS